VAPLFATERARPNRAASGSTLRIIRAGCRQVAVVQKRSAADRSSGDGGVEDGTATPSVPLQNSQVSGRVNPASSQDSHTRRMLSPLPFPSLLGRYAATQVELRAYARQPHLADTHRDQSRVSGVEGVGPLRHLRSRDRILTTFSPKAAAGRSRRRGGVSVPLGEHSVDSRAAREARRLLAPRWHGVADAGIQAGLGTDASGSWRSTRRFCGSLKLAVDRQASPPPPPPPRLSVPRPIKLA